MSDFRLETKSFFLLPSFKVSKLRRSRKIFKASIWRIGATTYAIIDPVKIDTNKNPNISIESHTHTHMKRDTQKAPNYPIVLEM